MQTRCHQKVLTSLLFALVATIATLGWACAADSGDDDSAGAGIGTGDAGTDADTVDCPDSDSCDCNDFHDDPDECEDVGCLPWSVGEYDIDKVLESDEHCDMMEDAVKESHDFCIDERDQDHNDAPSGYSQYDEDEDKWRVYVAPFAIRPDNAESLGLEKSCPPDDYPDIREACIECIIY